jgi:hypothetical protein
MARIEHLPAFGLDGRQHVSKFGLVRVNSA